MDPHLVCVSISMTASLSRHNWITRCGKASPTLTGCICSWHTHFEPGSSMHIKLTVVLVAIWLAGLGGIAAAVEQTDHVAVVASGKNPAGNLTKPDLRKIVPGQTPSRTG